MILIQDIDQEKVPDHNQAVTGDQGIEGLALLFAQIEHLFAIFEKDLYDTAAGLTGEDLGGF